jgi:hypothetical protein
VEEEEGRQAWAGACLHALEICVAERGVGRRLERHSGEGQLLAELCDEALAQHHLPHPRASKVRSHFYPARHTPNSAHSMREPTNRLGTPTTRQGGERARTWFCCGAFLPIADGKQKIRNSKFEPPRSWSHYCPVFYHASDPRFQRCISLSNKVNMYISAPPASDGSITARHLSFQHPLISPALARLLCRPRQVIHKSEFHFTTPSTSKVDFHPGNTPKVLGIGRCPAE